MDNKSSKFFSLYTSIHGRLLSYIMMMVHNQSAAEDLLQETLVVMWEKFDKFQEGTNFAAWSIAIARNKSLEYLRENRKTRTIFDNDTYEKLSYVAENSSADHGQRVSALDTCIKKLNKADQKILDLRYRHNIPVKHISLQIGRPVSSVYLHISGILGLLRVCVSRTLARQE
ncbi:MAG: sigma-70 family RNA polymerase sigma factor [Sedimentisphaerales bacterium]|nr:sigma-70 family RNA polymerase sigma factor [Sedimentisphaerales bacterium]MBN2843393.1 sigma-70 family RNA polymerase sigma factor [Sedimentisphaerales bacterium]